MHYAYPLSLIALVFLHGFAGPLRSHLARVHASVHVAPQCQGGCREEERLMVRQLAVDALGESLGPEASQC